MFFILSRQWLLKCGLIYNVVFIQEVAFNTGLTVHVFITSWPPGMLKIYFLNPLKI